jgi:hypothetical protein
MMSRPIAIRKGEVHRRPVVGSCVGNNVMKSSFGTVVVGKTVNRSVPVVVVVTATAVVVGATVVVAATVVVGAIVVELPATVVVLPATVVVVVVGAIVVVVVGAIVVVVGAIVVVVGAIVVVVVGAIVVVVVDGAIVVDVVLVVVGAAVVVVTGATIAPLLMDRSWLPTEQFLAEHMKSMRRMWYGEPLMEEADLPAPQSACDAMCPDHERTIVGVDAVK